jgi:hypothetical protein
LNQTLQGLSELSDSSTLEARSAYRAVFSQWQQVTLMQVGPLALDAGIENESSTGEGLAESFYRPLEDSCAIDEALVNQLIKDEPEWAVSPFDIRSLSAIEYLIFSNSSENTCSSLSSINQSGSWGELSAIELEERRLAYLKGVGDRVQLLAEQITERYAGSQDIEQTNFAEQIAQAGQSSSAYDSTQAAFNAWATALVAIDTQTRDANLGKPAGIAECFTVCPPESEYDDLAVLSIRRNLESLDLQLFGGVRNESNFTGDANNYPDDSGVGFDDILLEIGEDEFVDELGAAFDQAYGSIDALDASFADAIESDPASVAKAHEDLSTVVTLFKADLLSFLNLTFAETVSDTD